jgi:hypothetical protein
MPNIRTPSLISRRCETHSDYSNFQPCLTFNPHHILKTTDRLSKEVSYPLFRNRGYCFQLQISKPRNSATGFWRPTELLKRTLLGTPGNLSYLISCPNEKPLSCSKWVRQVVGTHGTRKRQEDRSPGDFCSKSVQFQLAVVPEEA